MAPKAGDSQGKLLDQAARWFVRLRADKVSARDRRAFEAWRTTSPAHEAAYRKACRLWEMLGPAAAAVYEEDGQGSLPGVEAAGKAPRPKPPRARARRPARAKRRRD